MVNNDFASGVQDAKLYHWRRRIALLGLGIFLRLRDGISSAVLSLAQIPPSHVFQLLEYLWPKYSALGEGIHIASLLKVFGRERWILKHIGVLSMNFMKLGKTGGSMCCPEPSLLCTVLRWWASGLVLRGAAYRVAHFSFEWQVQIQPQQWGMLKIICEKKICCYFVFKTDVIEWVLHAPLAYTFILMPHCIEQSRRCIYELELLKIQFLLERFITYTFILNLI